MFFWFIGTVTAIVVMVFRDPRFDYRLLVVGALLPDVVDGTVGAALGGALVLHSVLACVVVLIAVMALTVDRRPTRRRWLALPIGLFLHLVVDGAVDDATVFWWPLAGWSFEGARLPVVERGWWNLPLEIIGAMVILWLWRRHGLHDPTRRALLRAEGQLTPAAGAPPSPPPPVC